MPISTVELTQTFDQWRVQTNKTITAYNQIELANVQFETTTPQTLQINGITRGNASLTYYATSNVVSLSCNALPTTGGSLTGSLNVDNLMVRSNGMIMLGDMKIFANGHIMLI